MGRVARDDERDARALEVSATRRIACKTNVSVDGLSRQDEISWAGVNHRRVQFEKGSSVFRQGDEGSTVFHVERGVVRLSVVSPAGQKAIVEVLGPEAFFGEGCLAGQPRRIATATAMTACTIVEVAQREMARQLLTNPSLARRFLRHVLTRSVRIAGDLLASISLR